MATYLLEEARVATTSGSAFGALGEGHLRLVINAPVEEIERGAAIGEQARLAGGAGVAAVGAVADQQHAEAGVQHRSHLVGAVCDVAGVAVKVGDGRRAGETRGGVPRHERQAIVGG